MTGEAASVDAVVPDPSNAEQLRDWNGDAGAFWAAHAERLNEGVAGYHGHFFEAAAIDAKADVIDIGCGSGQTTRDAARRASDGFALGVDLSSRMIDLARRTAERERVPNARFEQADAQNHPFADRSFDIAISRNGTMFFGDPEAAFANIARALRPGGRLVLMTWQPFEENEWIRTFLGVLAAGRELPLPLGAPGPFSLSDPERVRHLLTSAGFTDVRLRGVSEPMYFGPDLDDAYRFVSTQFGGRLDGLDADARARALDALRAGMAEHDTDRGVLYDSAAWITVARRGPA
ncbi:class I SAM-dependent methyltransferase [Pseudonocardia yunnanensis]|uniref:Class I SAM-dependent methyltransferase n=1 Tax=Pseudonocardia yunnanensis TaxID=58107 RepID=A0ABW4FB54_9PSEU